MDELLWCLKGDLFVCLCRFDADLNAAKDESSSEVQAKEKLAREKEQLQVDFTELKEKIKVQQTKMHPFLHTQHTLYDQECIIYSWYDSATI